MGIRQGTAAGIADIIDMIGVIEGAGATIGRLRRMDAADVAKTAGEAAAVWLLARSARKGAGAAAKGALLLCAALAAWLVPPLVEGAIEGAKAGWRGDARPAGGGGEADGQAGA